MNLAAIAPHRGFFRRHPIVRDALLWCLPAFVAGTLLRTALISYLPYAFWGADSRSYFSFAHRLIADHAISLNEKRRYLYPLLLTPVAILPGPVLRWLAVFQHALGIASLWPLAYLIRKTMRHWKLWIVPATLLYSALPVIVWYEHELLGETVFFAALLWSFAGWVAWVDEPNLARSRRLFWCFLVPLAAFVLTKPSGRFAWPGVICGLLLVGAWRRLDWRQSIALAAVFAASLTAGSKKQGAWLLYTAAFPLTQLETPAHADYKREIRDLVEPLRDSADVYYLQDDVPFEFLQNPARHNAGPLWRALPNDSKQKTALYMDLALEGIKARPGMFACFGLQRVIASANLSAFRLDRFTGAYFRTRTEHFYAEGERDPRNRVRMAFGFSPGDQLPPYAEFQDRLDPHPHSWVARHFQSPHGRRRSLAGFRQNARRTEKRTSPHPGATDRARLVVADRRRAVLAPGLPGHDRSLDGDRRQLSFRRLHRLAGESPLLRSGLDRHHSSAVRAGGCARRATENVAAAQSRVMPSPPRDLSNAIIFSSFPSGMISPAFTPVSAEQTNLKRTKP